MPSRYDTPVDPAAVNNSHAFALELVGWNRRVLELGAAAGHVTRALAAQECRVTALEYEEAAARDLVGIAHEVIVGDLNDPDVFCDLQPDFDVVLAGDVLEHLVRPQDVLSRAVCLLKPGGEVVVSVPNVAHVDLRLSLMQGKWDYRPWGLLDETHLRFFTLEGIRILVRKAGLVLTELRRVRVPAFETELPVDRVSVQSELLDILLADPEAETYQFVFSATADNGDYRLRRLAEQNSDLRREVERYRIANSRLKHASTENRELRADNQELRAALAREQTRLARVDESVVWQLFTRLRRWIFALLGGEQSPSVRLLQATLRLLGRGLGAGGGSPAPGLGAVKGATPDGTHTKSSGQPEDGSAH
jgi:SAM-dependent methyltransferase